MKAGENTRHPLGEQHNRNHHHRPNDPERHLRPALPTAGPWDGGGLLMTQTRTE